MPSLHPLNIGIVSFVHYIYRSRIHATQKGELLFLHIAAPSSELFIILTITGVRSGTSIHDALSTTHYSSRGHHIDLPHRLDPGKYQLLWLNPLLAVVVDSLAPFVDESLCEPCG